MMMMPKMRTLDLHWQVLPEGVLTVWYFLSVIAILDMQGKIYWRDPRYPLYLIYYLLADRDHRQDRWC